MEPFVKIVNPCTFVPSWYKVNRGVRVFIKIEWSGTRLSITGVKGPKSDGDAVGSCGQIHGFECDTLAPGWDRAMVAKLRAVWKRWHLNDMTAGSPAQEEYLRANPVTFAYPQSHYEEATKALTAAGLNPAPDYLHNHKPYLYGHAWLHEDVPADVLEWLRSLPDTTVKPAWV